MSEYTFPKVFSYTEGSGSGAENDCRTLGCPNDDEYCAEVEIGVPDITVSRAWDAARMLKVTFRCIKDCSNDAEVPQGAPCKYCENGTWRAMMPMPCRIPLDANGDIKWPLCGEPGYLRPVQSNPTTHTFDETGTRCPIQTPYQDFAGGPIKYHYDNVCDCVRKKEAAYIQQGGKYNTGQPANWTEGDFNFDGVVDILDVAEAVSQPSSPPINTQTPIADVTPTLFFVGKNPTTAGGGQYPCGCTALDCECEDAGWVTAVDVPMETWPYRYVTCCPPDTYYNEQGVNFNGIWYRCFSNAPNGGGQAAQQDIPRTNIITCTGQAPDGCSAPAGSGGGADIFDEGGGNYRTFDPDPIVGQTTSSLSLDLDYTVTNDKPLILESNI